MILILKAIVKKLEYWLQLAENILCGVAPNLNIFHFQYLCLRDRNRVIRNYLSRLHRVRVLDVGCGMQPFRSYLDASCDYVGIDVYKAHKDTVLIEPNVPWPDIGKFDVVICTEVLEHVDDLKFIHRQINNVIEGNGRLLVTVPFMYPVHDAHDYWRFTVKGLNKVFDDYAVQYSWLSGKLGTVLVVFLLTWIANFSGIHWLGRLLYLAALPVRMVLNFLLNCLALIADKLDRTNLYFGGVICEYRRNQVR